MDNAQIVNLNMKLASSYNSEKPEKKPLNGFLSGFLICLLLFNINYKSDSRCTGLLSLYIMLYQRI